MKQLICELCESSDFLRTEEGFQCRSCGCTYSLEQARKMMRDASEAPAAPVAVIAAEPAPLSVASSYVPTASEQARYEKYLFVARRARLENNTAEAKKYYDLAMAEDPANLEAGFFNSYYAVMETSMLNLDGVFPAFQNRARSTIAKLLAEPEGMICHEEVLEYLGYTHEMTDMIVASKEKRLTEVFDQFLESVKLALQKLLNPYIINPYNSDELLAESNALATSIAGCLELILELYEAWNNKSPNLFPLEKTELLRKYDQTQCRLAGRTNTDFVASALKIEELMRQIDPDAKSAAVDRLWQDALADEKQEKPSDTYRDIKKRICNQRAASYWAAHPDELEELKAELAERQKELKEEQRRELPEKDEEKQLLTLKRKLESELSCLGMFKFKEKQALNERIDITMVKLSQVRTKLQEAERRHENRIRYLQNECRSLQEQIDNGK